MDDGGCGKKMWRRHALVAVQSSDKGRNADQLADDGLERCRVGHRGCCRHLFHAATTLNGAVTR